MVRLRFARNHAEAEENLRRFPVRPCAHDPSTRVLHCSDVLHSHAQGCKQMKYYTGLHIFPWPGDSPQGCMAIKCI